MSVAFELAAQQIIYTALAGNVGATVYDAVPELPPGNPTANFPFVVISDCATDPFDNDSTRGQDVMAELHVWSRAEGMLECKTIMGAIYAILHQQSFSLAGYSVLDSLCVDTTTMTEDDGETRHGVVRYRLTIQEA